jgi:hypothetical protein
MQVVAFSTPSRPEWRWRIVNYDGAMVEESYETFPSIATALSDGTLRLNKLDAADIASFRGR